MPELPEVETVMRGLDKVLTGARFARVEQRRADLRFPFPERFVDRLEGARVERLARRAKYMLGHLDSGEILVMHLGMSGRFAIHEQGANAQTPGEFVREAGSNPAHDHVVFEMSNRALVRYNDARRFGFMMLVPADELESHKFFRHLGVEPMGEDLTPDHLAAAFAGRQTSLKAALLDQRLVAGIGNIYACEALHRAGLSPQRKAGSVSLAKARPGKRAAALVAAIRSTLGDAIEAGGSTLRDHRQTDGSLGYFQHAFAVYDRADADCPKPGCGGIVNRIVQNGRSTFFCPVCQL